MRALSLRRHETCFRTRRRTGEADRAKSISTPMEHLMHTYSSAANTASQRNAAAAVANPDRYSPRNAAILDALERADGLAWAMAGKRSPQQHVREDIHAEAILGLVEAAERFDANHGASLTTFAWLRMLGRVRDHQEQATRIRRTRATFAQTPPTTTSISAPLRARVDMARVVASLSEAMPADERVVFDECLLAGRTVADVGRERGWSTQQAHRRNQSLLNRLRAAGQAAMGDDAKSAKPDVA